MGFPGGSDSKESAAMQEMQVQSLGQEDALEEEMATHSSILPAAVHEITKSQTQQSNFTFIHSIVVREDV